MNCDFSEYKKHVKEMKNLTLAICEAHFSCKESDSSQAIVTAYNNYVDYRDKPFNVFTKCSFTNFSPACAQVMMQTRPQVYASAENIMTSLITCAKLKSKGLTLSGNVQSQSVEIIRVPECNCMKIVNSVLY